MQFFRHANLKTAGQSLVEMAFWGGMVAGVDSKAAAKLSFEDALSQLETIVESMESGQVPLADLLAKFEEGNKLLKVCEARLKDAELRIEQLSKQKDTFTAFAATDVPRES